MIGFFPTSSTISSKGKAKAVVAVAEKPTKKSQQKSGRTPAARLSSSPPMDSVDDAGSLKDFVVSDGLDNIEWETSDDDVIGAVSPSEDGVHKHPDHDGLLVEDPNNPTPHRFVLICTMYRIIHLLFSQCSVTQ